MKRKILISLLAAGLFVGCAVKKEAVVEVPVVEKEEIIVPFQKVEEEVSVELKEVKKKEKRISYTYYRVVPKQIETFPYNKLGKNTIVNDSSLKNSFYLNGDLLRIERIYNSKSGAMYGKIAGKGLIVSMDDLVKK